jgi:hypothetical protein
MTIVGKMTIVGRAKKVVLRDGDIRSVKFSDRFLREENSD